MPRPVSCQIVAARMRTQAQRVDGAAYPAAWARGFEPVVIVCWNGRVQRTEVFGKVALVSATNGWTRRRDGVDTVGISTCTDADRHETDSRKRIPAQRTGVASGHPPPDDTIVRKHHRGVLAPV